MDPSGLGGLPPSLVRLVVKEIPTTDLRRGQDLSFFWEHLQDLEASSRSITQGGRVALSIANSAGHVLLDGEGQTYL